MKSFAYSIWMLPLTESENIMSTEKLHVC